ncbi:MAG TPA: response regulator transcription factor [Acidimicrobiales bacterium]|nr:response regulator transcription factor [Acidimicrobiales bacterium]
MNELPDTFAREGEYWTIAYRGKTFRLKDSKGLWYLAELLRHPGVEIHVLELVAAAAGTTGADHGGRRRATARSEGLSVGGLGDAGEVIDAQAKAAYRKRLRELADELDEAVSFNDSERSYRAQQEIDALQQQLLGAFGLGGRARKTASPAERARVNVRNSISTALKAMASHGPELADHLTMAVRTGTFCCYVNADRTWVTDRGQLDVAAPGSDSPGAATGAVTLMLVDDHPMWRQTLRTVLEGSGVGVVVAEASDGGEAIEFATRTTPDAVVMDMNLPTVNGVEATRRILAVLPQTKVLMLSSTDERAEVIAAVQAGASGYLLKTAEPDDVAAAVTRIYGGELVFPPALAKVVLEEFRRMGKRTPRRASARRAT